MIYTLRNNELKMNINSKGGNYSRLRLGESEYFGKGLVPIGRILLY